MLRRSALRASDADREYAAERLRDATAEGRLLAEELEHRLEAALSARTYGELDAVMADLPRPKAVGRPQHRSIRLRPATAVALLILFPLTVAIATALVVAIAALLTAWVVAVALVGLLLGSRGRPLAGPWTIGYQAWRGIDRRAYRRRRSDGRVVGSFTPWL